MRDRRLSIAVSLACGLLSTLVTWQECEAGRFCDWLFGRKNSQALANNAAPAANGLAGATAPTVTTAGYPPGTTCGPGFCQQTVVRYVPQIAYRTSYEPVPITTYRTSTSINPANGLPLTCTRPCTSYSYQARRVPYTTYRPVYTTVPVVLPATGTPAATQGQASVSTYAPGASAYAPATVYGYQPSAGASCNGCQTDAATQYSTTPGYAAGASDLSSGGAGSYTVPGTQSSGGPAPTPWQPVPNAANGTYSSPAPQGTTPADRPPSLRPEIEDGPYTQRSLRPVPMPESAPSRPNAASTFEQDRDNRRPTIESNGRLFSTPQPEPEPSVGSEMRNEASDYGIGSRPALEGPTNSSINETSRPSFDSRAVRDLQREQRDWNNIRPWSTADDKTAARQRPAHVGRSSLPQDSDRQSITRYAAVPIRWPVETRPADRDSLQQPASSNAWKWNRPRDSQDGGWVAVE